MGPSQLAVASDLVLGQSRVPFIGRANLWVEDSLIDRSSIQLVQEIVGQAITGTGPGQLEVLVYDENLSGVAAPFSALNNGGERLLDTIIDPAELAQRLAMLRQHVQGVNGVVQSKAPDLTSFRQQVAFPVEGYKLLVVSTDVSLLPDDVVNQLVVLFKAGPRAGVTTVVHSMTLGANPFMVQMCEYLKVRQGNVVSDDGQVLGPCPHPSAGALIGAADSTAVAVAQATLAPLPFTEIEPTRSTWTESSADGITFAIGRYGSDSVEITLGDQVNQRHNALITGAVGQGKSNLISVIVHSLCSRYSPEELELYLLDFKEGVTLQPLSGSDGPALPHARVLGLEADREFGLSVLRELFDLYRSRLRTFKASGVQGLHEYRRLPERPAMPRIVLVVDEFQMMLGERDRVTEEVAELLIRGVRLFRAAGIHVILASQTIGGNVALMGAAGDGLFSQIPVRLALKNSVTESRATLEARNEAAAHLRSREVIVNCEYGIPSASRKTSIAWADPDLMRRLRQEWGNRRAATVSPFVFNGEQRRCVLDDLPVSPVQGNPVVMLGVRVDVTGSPMAIPFSRAVGRNVAILDSTSQLRPLQSIAVSLALQSPPGSYRFHLLAPSSDDPDVRDLAVWLARLGQAVDVIDPQSLDLRLDELRAHVESGGVTGREFLIGLGLERFRTLPDAFSELCRTGPQAGLHVIGQWGKYSLFADHVGYGGEGHFDTKVLVRADAQGAKQFLGDPLLELAQTDNRATVSDFLVLDRPATIIPYTVLDDSLVPHHNPFAR